MAQVQARIVNTFGSEGGDVVQLTVGSTESMSYGDLLTLADPRTATNASHLGDGAGAQEDLAFAGIASSDKESTDGSVSIGAITNFIAESPASGAIIAGNPVSLSEDGYIKRSLGLYAGASGAIIAGYALETAADAESIEWRSNI